MGIAKLTPHRIRHWPQEQVKVLVDSREQQSWDLSPMRTETILPWQQAITVVPVVATCWSAKTV